MRLFPFNVLSIDKQKALKRAYIYNVKNRNLETGVPAQLAHVTHELHIAYFVCVNMFAYAVIE